MRAKVSGIYIGNNVRNGKSNDGKEYTTREITIIPQGEIKTVAIKFDDAGSFQDFLKSSTEGKMVEIPVNITTYNNYLYLKYLRA